MKTVHEVAELAHVSVRTLHHYDQIGLLKPSGRTEAGYRLYDDADLVRLQQIMLFRELEFPLKDIAAIIDSPSFDQSRALQQQIEEMMENKMIDIGISVLPVQSDSLYVEKLFTERFCCIVNRRHKLADRASLSLDDIIHEKIAMADENYGIYHVFQKKCEERGVVPDVYKSPDLMSIYEYVLNHYAIGFSMKAFADRFHIDQIRSIPHSDPDAVWDICFLTRDTDQSRYQTFAKDFTRDHIKIR